MEELNASGTPLMSPLFPFLASPRFDVFLKLLSDALKSLSFQRDPEDQVAFAYVDLTLDRSRSCKDCAKEGRLRAEGTDERRLDELSERAGASWEIELQSGWRWSR